MIDFEDVSVVIEPGSHLDSTAQEVIRNLRVLYATHAGEQALDRDFGIDAGVLDYPIENTQALIAAEYVRKTERYEPRARVLRVEWLESNLLSGGLKPKVVIEIV